MKRFLCVFLLFLTLTGCKNADAELNRAIALRDRLLQNAACTFDAIITADYGEKVYTFSLNCQTDALGNLRFTVLEPQSIAGIAGQISEEGGALTFDDQVLAFETLADGLVTPVCAPWLLMKTLRSGYLRACGMEGEFLRIIIDDSYEQEALQVDVWVSNEDVPTSAEILWQGYRVLSVEVKNFQYT